MHADVVNNDAQRQREISIQQRERAA